MNNLSINKSYFYHLKTNATLLTYNLGEHIKGVPTFFSQLVTLRWLIISFISCSPIKSSSCGKKQVRLSVPLSWKASISGHSLANGSSGGRFFWNLKFLLVQIFVVLTKIAKINTIKVFISVLGIEFLTSGLDKITSWTQKFTPWTMQWTLINSFLPWTRYDKLWTNPVRDFCKKIFIKNSLSDRKKLVFLSLIALLQHLLTVASKENERIV